MWNQYATKRHMYQKQTFQCELGMLRLDSATPPLSVWGDGADFYRLNEIPEDGLQPDNQLGLDEYAKCFEDPCQTTQRAPK